MFRNLPTFKSLPQAIGLPFLSTQEDAQLKFKSGENGLKRLSSDDAIPLTDIEYWSQYYLVFGSAADVYSLITVHDVRQAINSNPANLNNLIVYLSHHLFTLLPSPLFPSQPSRGTAQDTTREALNCLRVLSRVLVVAYENDADIKAHGIEDESFAQKYLWSRSKIETPAPEAEAKEVVEDTQFEIGDDEDEEQEEANDDVEDEGAKAFKATVGHPPKTSTSDVVDDPLSRPAPAHEEPPEEHTGPCLIDRLFSCTIDLLFCAGFTVPDSVRSSDSGEKINYVIWEKGVGSTVSIGSTAELDRNKTEVLRFLLVLLSTTIYTPPHALATTPNLPLRDLTLSLERRLVLSLLCSFLNTSLTSARANLGVGGQIPFNHLISKAAEERQTLVRGCFMTLLVALDYRVPDDHVTMGEGREENAFRYFLSKLHRKEDFAFVLGGIVDILEEHTTAGYLPGSKQPVSYVLETFILLWRIVDLNKRFRAYLFDSGKAPSIIGYILLVCLEHKDDPSHHGLLRLLSYLLQTLSADQEFANALKQTLRVSIPTKWAVSGSLADFMIVSIYSIATTPGLNPLFPALTISIANAAPYLQNIGVQASTRLLQLFKAFSAPNFLLADESHPRLVYYLLETFNSVIYHQLNENPNLVYAILRSHPDFQTLATFTLVSGLRDIQRRKALRQVALEKAKKDEPGLKRTNSELDMLAEKAALLGRVDDEVDEESTLSTAAVISPTVRPLESPDVVDKADPLIGRANIGSPEPAPAVKPMSEKARGKMRAASISSTPSAAGENDVADEELKKVASAGVGPNGYIPTQEWVTSWQKGLPLDPVLVAISELLPQIQDSASQTAAPSSKVLNVIRGASLTDVLPPAQPVIPRRFQWSPASAVWLTSLLWGDIYVAGLTSIGIWRDTTVRLFGVKQAPVKGRGAQVERVLKRLGVV